MAPVSLGQYVRINTNASGIVAGFVHALMFSHWFGSGQHLKIKERRNGLGRDVLSVHLSHQGTSGGYWMSKSLADAYSQTVKAAHEASGKISSVADQTGEDVIRIEVANITIKMGDSVEVEGLDDLAAFSEMSFVSLDESHQIEDGKMTTTSATTTTPTPLSVYQSDQELAAEEGGLVIPYVPAIITFRGSYLLLMRNRATKDIQVELHAQQDLARFFELTSDISHLVPAPYQCRLLRGEPLTRWDITKLMWLMRGKNREIRSKVKQLEAVLGIDKVSGLGLLSPKNMRIDLEGSQLDLYRAVLAVRKLRALCV
ncbi:uncharacterized protein V1516DRAFT_665280 [Lipomyces oligophaga]|uniref:uncharacterized protein n=1 Tax=Lipomyces oligophaga TaxID=45792 RepID=UPI0034CE3C44